MTEAFVMEEQEGAEPVMEGRRPRKPPLVLERAVKNPPASWAWNGQKGVVGTGESLLDPVGLRPTRERACL